MLADTRRIAKEIETHFAALERLFDEGEALARDVDRDFIELASHSGAVLYAKELGDVPLAAILRVAARNRLRDVFARWRAAAERLA